ncbi:MAG: FliH/SctL family protein [Planctomycetota bacterium]
MAVIKADSSGRAAKDAVVLDLADITQQSQAMLAAARREAASIVEAARRERADLLAGAGERGHAEGYQRGLAEGRAQGELAGRAEAVDAARDQLGTIEAAWAAALEEFNAQRDHLVVACKQDVLRLILTVAERVVHRVAAIDPALVIEQIEGALALVASRTRVVVSVPPGDAPIAREAWPTLSARLSQVEHAEFVEDDTLPPGSCVIRQSDGGEIDATLESQLERLASLIAGADWRPLHADPSMPLPRDGGDGSPGEIAA